MRHILEGGRSGFFLVSHTSGIKYRNGTLHSCQASDLFGRNGWPRLLQHASEIFVANLALPFKEKMKWEKKEIRILWLEKKRKDIPLDAPRLHRSNLYANRDAVKKPRSDATGKKEQSRILSLKFLFFSLFFPLHLPDAARPSALRATWPHCCSERALQTTCARSSSAYRPCFRCRKPRLVGRCSRARPRGAHCTGEPGGPRLRTPPWPRRGDQSRRRAIWGPFSHVLV